MNKQEELELLTSLCQQVPEGTYLADLLTPRLCDWFAAQIHSDITPDVMDALQHGINEKVSALETLAAQNRMIERLERERDTVKTNLTLAYRDWDASRADYTETLNAKDLELNRLSAERAQYKEELRLRNLELKRMEQHMLELKAHLYDLTMEE